MAEKLSRLHGTEEDKVNCPFFYKIGACRHGDRCSRAHNKPLFSQTICLKAMYVNPMASVVTSGGRLTRDQEKQIQDQFEDFYIDVFEEVGKFGDVEDVLVCDNLSDHLIGNVYVKYNNEEDAASALTALNGRWYTGRQLTVEYSPVTEFREARCRQFDEQGCNRGPYCNFMHLKYVAREMKDELQSLNGHAPSGGGGRDRTDDGRGGGDRGGPRGGGGGGDRDRGGGRGRSRSPDHSRDRGGGGDRGGPRGIPPPRTSDRPRSRSRDRDMRRR